MIRFRKWRYRVAISLAGILLFTTLWTFMTLLIIAATQDQSAVDGFYRDRRDSEAWALRKAGDGRDDYIGHGVQVVVGHYNGKLPEEPKFNITDEEKDELHFEPVEGEGEMGHGLRLTADEEVKSKRSFSINQFNLVASDKISLNRSLPDVRKRPCKEKTIPEDLPSTSVIIVFHNEAWSTLLRTVTSVIIRSPRRFLREIILVDDDSEREFLRQPLEDFVATLPVPVVVLRAGKRVGLIRARLIGAKAAKGDVLTFLDSHCECTIGWLEPLLMRIKDDRKNVVCPVIDVVNDKTFAYQRGLEMFRGGFNWNLQFRWYSTPPEELKLRKKDPTAPIKSPTMAGGLFSIDKSYFEELGTYDNQMDIWGGENLEMSFRIWQCGGNIEILPCSHVGHIFRKASPHDFPDKKSGQILNSNLVRVAEVWMDNWKNLFYKTAPQAYEISKKTDVSERVALRKRLQCKDFHWYLTNVWTDHFLPMEGEFFGRIENPSVSMCLEVAYVDAFGPGRAKKSSMEKCGQAFGRLQISNTAMYECIVGTPGEVGKRRHTLSMKQCTLGFDLWQLWIFTKNGSIKSDEHQCLGAMEINSIWIVQLKECQTADYEVFTYDTWSERFKHKKSGLCLDKPQSTKPHETHTPTLKKCSRFSSSQTWKLHPVSYMPKDKS